MLGAIALLLAAQSPSLDAKVTFLGRAERAEILLPKLSKAVGITLEAGPQMRDEVILVSAKSVSIRALMDRIATVTAGEWKTVGETYRLGPSANKRALEAQVEFQARIRDIRAKLAPPAPNTSSAAKEDGMDDVGSNACNEILAMIDPSILANIRTGDRVVFSTRPTRAQRPLPNAANAVISRAIQEHNEGIAPGTEPIEEPDQVTLPPEMQKMMRDMLQRSQTKITGVGKAILIVGISSMGQMGQSKLKVLDPKGIVVLEDQGTFGGGFMDYLQMARDAQKPANRTKSTPIKLSAEALAYSAALAFEAPTRSKDPLPDIQDKIDHPDLYDPLSFGTSERLIALAESLGKPIVASLPDTTFGSRGFMTVALADTVEGVQADIKKGNTIRALPDSEFLLLASSEPATDRQNRVDRKSLSALIASAKSKRAASLDDLATFAATNVEPLQNVITTSFLTGQVPGSNMITFGGITNWDILRYYGSLTPGQRGQLDQGRLPIAGMSAQQVQIVSRLVYGMDSNLTVSRPGEPATSNDDPFQAMFGMAFSMFGSTSRDFRDEPTEALPNGLPPNGYLEVMTSNEPIFVPPTSKNPMLKAFPILSATELALFRFMKDAMPDEGNEIPIPTEGQMGERKVHRFRFTLSPIHSVTKQLNDDRVPIDGAKVAFGSLPASFEALVAQRIAQLKKSPLGSMGAFGSRQTPPP